MDHHRHVDVVEMALGDEFGLAQQELDFAALLAMQALLDIDELLGRDGEEDQFAGEVLGGTDLREAHRDPEHAGDLGVVAAAVRRTGVRIGEGMVGGSQAVQFAEDGEAWTRTLAAQRGL